MPWLRVSLQPNFSLDSLCYRDRLPEEYCRRNNPFRMLLDEAGYVAGKDLILGSDGMPHGVQCALESALFPPFPGQRLALDEFVAGYCMPDCRDGYIDIDVDYEGGKVKAKVVLKEFPNPCPLSGCSYMENHETGSRGSNLINSD